MPERDAHSFTLFGRKHGADALNYIVELHYEEIDERVGDLAKAIKSFSEKAFDLVKHKHLYEDAFLLYATDWQQINSLANQAFNIKEELRLLKQAMA